MLTISLKNEININQLPKKHSSVRRWGKHALERHNQRDYDGNFSDGDSSTSTESSTDSSVSCQNSNLHVDSSLIRTVEERARRRLQELDYAEKELADSTNLNSDSRSSSTYTSQRIIFAKSNDEREDILENQTIVHQIRRIQQSLTMTQFMQVYRMKNQTTKKRNFITSSIKSKGLKSH